MNIVVYVPSPARRACWVAELRRQLGEARVYDASDDYVHDTIDYAVVWKPVDGWLAEHPHLRAVVSIGAGIDHVLRDRCYPYAVPLIRTTGEELTQRMREYVALQVLRFHRRLPELEKATRERHWQPLVTPPACERTTGVMGLGSLGGPAASTLAALGFRVKGWSRRRRQLPNVVCYAGQSELPAFLADCDILVCLLPLSASTTGILDAALFEALPRGAFVVNAARGEHLNEHDLLAALGSGQIKGAALDVFEREPLPDEHPFWQHPDILLTPHIAALIEPATGGRLIAANLREFHRHGRCNDLVDSALSA